MTKISYGIMLEDAFAKMKENFAVFFLTYLIFQVVMLLLLAPFLYLSVTGEEPSATIMIWMVPAIILLLCVTVYFNMLFSGMALHAVTNNKADAKSGMLYAKKYFWKYFGVVLLLVLALLILIVPFVLALVLVVGSSAYVATNAALGVIGIIAGSLIALVLLVLIAIFMASIIFLLPKTVIEDKSPYMLIKESIKYHNKEPGHVWSTAGVVFSIAFCLGIIGLLFDLPFTLSGITLSNISFQSAGTIIVFMLVNIIKTIIQIVLSIYLSLFITESYVAGFQKEVEGYRWLK